MPQNVMIAVISYSRASRFELQDALTSLMLELLRRGVVVEKKTRAGDSMLPRARNAVVADFLAGDATDLLMVDDDNYCDAADLLRLLDAPADVVGVPIRCKEDAVRWNVAFLPRHDLAADGFGLVEVDTIGTGIMRVTRAALERMALAGRWYHDATTKTGRAYELFAYTVVDHQLRGEDVTFCKRWRSIGGKVHALSQVVSHHIGPRDYPGSLAGWLGAQPPQLEIVATDGSSSRVANGFRPRSSDGRVVVCVASRGRPELLRRTVEATLANSMRADTMVSVALDEDDVASREVVADWTDPRVIISFAPREDSLGAKYNRAAALCPGDLYVVATDDAEIATPGFDDRLAAAAATLPGRLGVVYFGTMCIPSALPAAFAVTRAWVQTVGYLLAPHFPTWWHDTWTDEIARMTGTIATAEVEVRYPDGAEAARSRGIRDIRFWAKFFEDTRPLRLEAAAAILADPVFDGRRAIAAVPSYNQPLLDAEHAKKLERTIAFDAPEDARYDRIKQAAAAILRNLLERAA